MHARWTKHGQRALHKIVAGVWRADDGQIFSGGRNFFYADLYVDRLRRLDASVENSYQAVLLLDGSQQLTKLRLIGELGGADNLGGPFYVHLAGLAFAKHRNIHFPLLADFEPKGDVSRAYRAYRTGDGYSERALFTVDPEGMISWSYLSPIGVNPGADGILRALEALAPTGRQPSRRGGNRP